MYGKVFLKVGFKIPICPKYYQCLLKVWNEKKISAERAKIKVTYDAGKLSHTVKTLERKVSEANFHLYCPKNDMSLCPKD